MKRLTVIAVMVSVLLIGGTAHALYQSWTMVRIAVPTDGYFHKHKHCRTEDMVLDQVNYPNGVEWKCVHVDKAV